MGGEAQGSDAEGQMIGNIVLFLGWVTLLTLVSVAVLTGLILLAERWINRKSIEAMKNDRPDI